MGTIGLGGIRQRKDGQWLAKLSINGKPTVKYARNRTEALEKLYLLQALKRSITGPSYCTLTVEAYLNQFLKDIAPTYLRQNTVLCYSDTIANHIVPAIGHLKLAQLSSNDIRGMFVEMKDDGASPRMLQLTYSVLSSALKHALPGDLNYIEVSPLGTIAQPKVAFEEQSVWNAEEVRTFLDSTINDRLYPLYLMAITCGLCQGELLGLFWENLDLDAGTVSVQRTLIEQRGVILGRFDVKTTKRRRVVSMPQILVEALRKHRDRLAQEGLASYYVFPTIKGGPYHKSNLSITYKAAIARAGLPEIRFHDLRHTSSTMLLKNGTHPKVMQARAGHSQIGTTLNIYSHVLPPMDLEAANAMDAILMKESVV